MEYRLRIEAMNLDAYLGDLHDISTIRGGGYWLLDIANTVRLEPIFAGASAGLFKFDDSLGPPEPIVSRVRANLSKHIPDAVFAVSCVEFKGDEQKSLAELTALNRFEQMQMPTVVMPRTAGDDVCELTDLLPANEGMFRKGAAFLPRNQRHMQVNARAKARREFGIDQAKHSFYEAELGPPIPAEFVNDFEQLTDLPAVGRLHGKLALVYLDGDGFGSVTSACKNATRLAAWSNLIRQNQRSFLSHIVNNPRFTKPEWAWTGDVVGKYGNSFRKENAFRLETLMWGGDELEFAIPAWQGWSFLAEFFATYGKLPGGRGDTFAPEAPGKLTHSAVIVFCHHHAPILRVRDLARKLATQVKSYTPGRNALTFQVLESFDHLGSEPDDTRAARLPLGKDLSSLVLSAESMHEVTISMERIRRQFPRGKLYQVLNLGATGRPSPDLKIAAAALSKYKLQSEFASLRNAFGVDDIMAWLHITELWDYTPPCDWRMPRPNLVGGN